MVKVFSKSNRQYRILTDDEWSLLQREGFDKAFLLVEQVADVTPPEAMDITHEDTEAKGILPLVKKNKG